MLSYLGNDLMRVVRTRQLVSVAVSGDRYSVCYSVPSWACCLRLTPARAQIGDNRQIRRYLRRGSLPAYPSADLFRRPMP